MRTAILAACLVLAGVGVAWAQQVERPQVPPRTSGNSTARHGASRTPAPSVSPSPPPATTKPSPPRPPSSEPQRQLKDESPFAAGPLTYAPRYRPSQRRWPPYYWGAGFAGYGAPYEVQPPVPPQTEPRGSTDDQLSQSGVLELEVEPRTADVYVDGFFVGTADDVAQNGLVLRAGRHWVDVRASGYETLTVQITIVAGQYSRYRRDLAFASGSVSNAVRPAPGPQTIYVIPGCFAGNRPPVEATLPRGCDIANMRVTQP